MAERKAVNKYYPPDWDPSKGSVNKYVGQHPLRERSRKLKEGILIIRFEMPFNIWCSHCNQHIGMGVRYNAEKKKIGCYFSTPIYSFRMKCHLCGKWIEIHTDPKNSEYVITSGATRKVESCDQDLIENISLTSQKESEKRAVNPFFRVESAVNDRDRAESFKSSLEALEMAQERIWKDDYTSSRMARYKFRKEKKELGQRKIDIIKEANLGDLTLVEETEEDVQKSKATFSSANRKPDSPTPVQLTAMLKKRRMIK